jgi:WD40 repeat protein
VKKTVVFMLLIFIATLSLQPATAQDESSTSLLLEPITAENAERLELIGDFSRGRFENVLWSPDGEIIAVLNQTGVWLHGDVRSNHLLNPLGYIYKAAFSPDGSMLAYASGRYDGYMGMFINVWDVQSGDKLFTHNLQIGVSPSFSFSPDGAFLVIGEIGLVSLWDTRTWEKISELTGGTQLYRDVAFSPDGHQLVGIDSDGILWLWNTANYEEVQNYTLVSEQHSYYRLLFSPDSGTLAINASGSVYVFNLTTQSIQPIPAQIYDGYMAFSPDSRFLALAPISNTFDHDAADLVTVWDVQNNELFAELPGYGPLSFEEEGLAFRLDRTLLVWRENGDLRRVPIAKPVDDFWISPDYTTVATIGELYPDTHQTQLYFWDVQTGALNSRMVASFPSQWFTIAFNVDGSKFAVGGPRGGVQIWSNNDPASLASPQNATSQLNSYSTTDYYDPVGGSVYYFVFAPRDDLLVYNACSEVSFVGGFTLERTFVGDWDNYDEPQCAGDFAFSPDGSQLISKHIGGAMRWWNVEQLLELGILGLDQGFELRVWQTEDQPVGDFIFTSDGEQLVMSRLVDSEARVQFYDAQSLEMTDEFIAMRNVESVGMLAFSPDERLLALGIGGMERYIIIFDTQTGEPIQTIPNAWIDDLEFNRDATVLLGASEWGFSLYSVSTGEELVNYMVHSGSLGGLDIAFHPSGMYLVSASDSTIRMWGVPSE